MQICKTCVSIFQILFCELQELQVHEYTLLHSYQNLETSDIQCQTEAYRFTPQFQNIKTLVNDTVIRQQTVLYRKNLSELSILPSRMIFNRRDTWHFIKYITCMCIFPQTVNLPLKKELYIFFLNFVLMLRLNDNKILLV